MQAVFFIDRRHGSFNASEHDLDDFLAKALIEELRAQGREVYGVVQLSMHGGVAERCEHCRHMGAEFFAEKGFQVGNQESNWSSPNAPRPAGAASERIETGPKRNIPLLPSGVGQRLFSLFAVLVLGMAAYLFTTGPLAPYFNIFTQPLPAVSPPPMASLLSPTSSPTRPPTVTEQASLPALPTQKPARTPRPSPTTGKVSLDPTATATTVTAAESGCTSYSSITNEDAGRTVCITGTVARSYTKNGAFLILFEDRPGVMYLVSYDREWAAAKTGVCIQAAGKVEMLGSTPVMVFGWQSELSTCP